MRINEKKRIHFECYQNSINYQFSFCFQKFWQQENNKIKEEYDLEMIQNDKIYIFLIGKIESVCAITFEYKFTLYKNSCFVKTKIDFFFSK